jgi:hypothetical protein
VMVQIANGAGAPLTVACNVTWPLEGIVTDIGETVTVTLLGLNPLLPQPVVAMSRTSAPTHSARYESIVDLLDKEQMA